MRDFPVVMMLSLLGLLVAGADELKQGVETDQSSCTRVIETGQSVQEAIDSAYVGDVLCLGAGIFHENIQIVKDLTLRGSGQSATLLKGRRANYPIGIIGGEAKVTLEKLTMTSAQGNCVARFVCAHGLLVQGNAQVTLISVRISNNRQAGLLLWGTSWTAPQVAITDSEITDNRTNGIQLLGRARLQLIRSQIARSRFEAIQARDQSHVTVLESSISNNEVDGISMWDQSTLELQSSQVVQNRSGIIIRDGVKAVIRHGQISDHRGRYNQGFGILAYSDESPSNTGTLVIEDSSITGNREGGLVVRRGASVTLTNTRIIGNHACGVEVDASAEVQGQANEIQSNGADLCGYAPSRIRTPLAPPTDRQELRVPEDYATIQQAVDAAPAGAMIRIGAGSYVGGLTLWKPVTLRGSGSEQSQIQASEDGQPAISIIAEAYGVQLIGLAIQGSRWDGIEVYGEAVLQDCKLTQHGRAGLTTQGTARVSIRRCQLSQNNFGLSVSGDTRVEFIESEASENKYEGVSVGSLTGNPQVVIRKARIFKNIWTGIEIAGNSLARVEETEVASNGNGISVSGTAELLNNTVHGNQGSPFGHKGYGILAEEESLPICSGNRVYGNTIDFNEAAAKACQRVGLPDASSAQGRADTD